MNCFSVKDSTGSVAFLLCCLIKSAYIKTFSIHVKT